MSISPAVEASIDAAGQEHTQAHSNTNLPVVTGEPETLWPKLDHLLYLPILGLTRPRDLYYYQGKGLRVLYGFTYKYLTVEHFAGQLTRWQVGYPLADALADCYSQAWYPGQAAIFIFTDWHTKPHWTKQPAHSGHIAMWERIMPGTKQLIINGPGGHLLGGWDYVVDNRLSHVLVDLEIKLADKLQRPIAYNVFDSEGGGQPTGERYAEAKRCYLSVLPRQGDQRLSEFELLGEWEPVEGDPDHQAVKACWQDRAKADQDSRQLVLMRLTGQENPSRVYVGRMPEEWSAGSIPGRFRQRWLHQERVIRQMIAGANLNANFGYTYQEVPNRTHQRQWEKAQESVETSERQLAERQDALINLGKSLTRLRQSYRQEQAELIQQIETLRAEMRQRQEQGQAIRQCQRGLCRRQRRLAEVTHRLKRRRHELLKKVAHNRTRRSDLQRDLAQRQVARDAIDTQSLCRERSLEKDQLMLDVQVLLTNLHDWTRQHYFAPEWQRLELDTAIQLIYRKPGRVYWKPDTIEVVFDPYRYPEHQQAMEESCRRLNAAQVCWRDGRLFHFRVEPDP